jgi:hypothetical protein
MRGGDGGKWWWWWWYSGGGGGTGVRRQIEEISEQSGKKFSPIRRSDPQTKL